ncbi:hypothetical protein TWF173_006619 [Orbilia oligospora]|nr:hypothetical protein TWF173_006619 [Orbilia oligospora]
MHRIAAPPPSAWGSSVISVARQRQCINIKSSERFIRTESKSSSAPSELLPLPLRRHLLLACLLASTAYARASHRNLHASYYILTQNFHAWNEQTAQTSAGDVPDETNGRILCAL